MFLVHQNIELVTNSEQDNSQEEDMENQFANENEIKMESLPRNAWNENIREVITNSTYQNMIENRELQIEAKKGNEDAELY